MQAVSAQQRPLNYLYVSAIGAAFAVLTAWMLSLEPRYAFAGICGLLLTAASLTIAPHLADVVLVVIAFNLPFTGIEKTFFQTQYTTFVVPGVSVGLADICLAILYLWWFGRILITRTQGWPALRALDYFVLLFWLLHLLSLCSAASRSLTFLEVIRLGKLSLLYFYIAHNLQRRNLKWIAVGLFFALTLQTGIAMVQFQTGKLLGIGQTKGAEEKSYEQYTVDGFENVRRAEGTTFDSHALGLFCGMALLLPLALALTKDRPLWQRVISGVFFLIGVQGLALSFSRAGWVSCGFGALVAVILIVKNQYRTKWNRVIPALCMAVILGIAALTPVLSKVRQRLFEAPPELLTARVETIEMGLEMWRPVAWTGIGANNYMLGLERNFSIFEGNPYFIPAHNMLVFILVELGVLGIIGFAILSWAIIRAAWRSAHNNDLLVQSFAVALLGGFIAFQIEGFTDPIYVTNVTYFYLWFQLGMIGGLERLTASAAEETKC
jgi:hypothetical protein